MERFCTRRLSRHLTSNFWRCTDVLRKNCTTGKRFSVQRGSSTGTVRWRSIYTRFVHLYYIISSCLLLTDIVPWYHVPVKLLQLFSADTRNMDKLLGLLAVFSQMQNDYQNLQSDKVSYFFIITY